MLKKLYEEIGAPGRGAGRDPRAGRRRRAPRAARRAPGRSRDNPVDATVVSRMRLNKPGSEKETWHVEFDLTGSRLDYVVGDSFGIMPVNDPGAGRCHPQGARRAGRFPDRRPHAARGADRRRVAVARRRTCCSSSIPTSPAASGGRRRRRSAPARTPTAMPRPSTCSRRSRSSAASGRTRKPSSKRSIRCSRGSIRSRLRSRRIPAGCRSRSIPCATRSPSASASASPRPSSPSACGPATPSRSMCRRRTNFGLPADPAVPIIMVGPGTGIAPFRAFLYERMATKASGRNWLFFGHQRRDCDFFYEDELAGMRAAGVLTRLSLAWSRDDKEKFYVQDRMRQVGAELWQWLADGAHVYVCGAVRMGQDVERALVDIVAEHGARSDRRGDRLRQRPEEARAVSGRRVLTHDHRTHPRTNARRSPPAAHGAAGAAAGVPRARGQARAWSPAARRPRPGRRSCCRRRARRSRFMRRCPARNCWRSRPSRRAARSSIHRRAWTADDIPGAAIAIGACDDDDEAARFAAAARAAGVPVNVIDKPAFCDFAFGAIVNRSPLVIGISTDGAAPVFGQAIRAKLEALIPRGFARWAEAARRWRSEVKASGLSFNGRRRFWQIFTDACGRQSRPRAGRCRLRAAARRRREPRRERATTARSRWSAPARAIRSCLTLRAVRALQSADVILFDDLVSPEILEFARREAKKMLVGKTGHGPSCKQDEINAPDGGAREGRQAAWCASRAAIR